MGLDMFLYGEMYLGDMMKNTICSINSVREYLQEEPTVVLCRVGYWRKAQEIHDWFVRNCQDGVDNCAMYVVSEEELQKLLDTCKGVLDGSVLIEEEFGDIDNYNCFMYDIKDTIEQLENALSKEYDCYIYSSSW